MITKRVVLFYLLSVLGGAGQDKPPGNPVPLAGDVVLPMPGTQPLVLRPVGVGGGKSFFQSKIFKIGDRAEGGYQEFPTDISVGGSVLMPLDGEQQWVYFIGKYEITEAQWHAVMGGGTPEEAASEFPKRSISWFEAQDFINKLNQWLFANALPKLPQNEGSPCFVRLPTEAEWEFAARGGQKVSANEFDRKHPYTGKIGDYEWFSGARSSNDKVKRIGRRKANPLGLHDMLGNVAEMTCSQYSVEYFQGRVGGMVTRGGHYLTTEDKIRASARDEFPIYNPEDGYKPRRIETLGLRVVLSAPIFSNPHIHAKMENEWETYRKVRTVPTLASPSAPNRSSQAGARIKELEQQLGSLQKAIEADPSSPDVRTALGLAMGAAQNIQADANGVETLLTTTLLEGAFYQASVWGQSEARAAICQDIVNNAETQQTKDLYLPKLALHKAGAAIASAKYAQAIRRLGGTDEAMSLRVMGEKIEEEKARPASEKSKKEAELKMWLAIQKHLADYRKNQRFGEAAARAELLHIFQQEEE